LQAHLHFIFFIQADILKKILIIQTAFIGDVVLATAIIEKLHNFYQDACIDFLLRKGNESLLTGHPYLKEVIVWDKKQNKYANLWSIILHIRNKKYDLVINLQRFAASGLLASFSGAKLIYGFDKNPFSFLFTKSFPHIIGKKGDLQYLHETDRNQAIIAEITDHNTLKPKLYPSIMDFETVSGYQNKTYITISPASVWFTKQYPADKWIELIDTVPAGINIYLTGGKSDLELCLDIKKKSNHPEIEVLAGKLSYLQTAALMQKSGMNYTNDSAPLHFASAMDAPVTAVFCSTIPEFGFGPLSTTSNIAQEREDLECRPCGLHGYRACPKGHFKCAYDINLKFE